MKANIILSAEAIERLQSGRCVEGSLRMNLQTSELTFNMWKKRKRRSFDDNTICQLEHGWIKESPQRIKFFNSVKKNLGRHTISTTFHRELKTAMTALEVEESINRILSN